MVWRLCRSVHVGHERAVCQRVGVFIAHITGTSLVTCRPDFMFPRKKRPSLGQILVILPALSPGTRLHK